MSKEKFTPGPWLHVINRPPLIMGPEGEEIAVIKRNERCSYNATLIAAAPEMYNSTKDLAECLAEVFTATINGDELPEALIAMTLEEVEKAANILKKARGEE